MPQGPIVVAAAVASPTPDSAEGEAYAATILGRVNELRAGMGRAPLVRYVQLDAAAQAQSEQMAADGAVSHRPNFANSYPAGSSSSAEIVAVQAKADGADVAGQIVDQWMASEEDRAKMTAADANAVGIGIAYSPSTDSWYVTQSLAAYPDAAASGLTRTDGAPTAPQEPSASASPDPTTPAAPEKPSAPPSAAQQPTAQATRQAAGATTAAGTSDPGALPVDNAPADDSASAGSSPAPVAVAPPPDDSKRTSSSGWGPLPVTGVTLTGLVLAAGLLGAGFTLRGFRRRPVQEI
ncbi:CAP domain-containing protein [Actinomyces dentalis]|uniref:CAP domain-containing protein n=1 Tax=Actinomyces dentalis TaxID=272548 RepID=UPI0023527C8A|nr:CAP domain-containing protein [Actinomyces dentalis]